jgi:hypothetical protein
MDRNYIAAELVTAAKEMTAASFDKEVSAFGDWTSAQLFYTSDIPDLADMARSTESKVKRFLKEFRKLGKIKFNRSDKSWEFVKDWEEIGYNPLGG